MPRVPDHLRGDVVATEPVAIKPYWRSACGRFTIYVGDNLKVMAALDEQSFDAVITDPPYGLGNYDFKGVVNRLYRVLFNVVFPNLNQFDPALSQDIDLRGILVDGSPLCWRRLATIESLVHVPKSSVNFNSSVVVQQEEIDTSTVHAGVRVAKSELRNVANASPSKFLGDYVLDLRDSAHLATSNLLSSDMAEFGLGFFTVPVTSIFLPGSADLLHSFLHGEPSFIKDVVSHSDNSLGSSNGSTGVVACSGTVHPLVLRFDLAGRSIKLCSASGACQYDGVGKQPSAKLVAASAGARRAPTMFQSCRVDIVGAGTNRTGHFNLFVSHDIWPSLQSIITSSGGFMGKTWDSYSPGISTFDGLLRVCKPGAHLLSFGGTRMWHRMACAVEDAGWDIRDCLMWVYGSGFPKSHDVSKAIDKYLGIERNKNILRKDGKATNSGSGCYGMNNGKDKSMSREFYEGEPATPQAAAWQGWGTALKPSYEPMVMARKPFTGTVAENVLAHGCGGINVDGCRVGTDPMPVTASDGTVVSENLAMASPNTGRIDMGTKPGRWPANLIHDGSEEVVELFPEAGGGSSGEKSFTTDTGGEGLVLGGKERSGAYVQTYSDQGSASRFFYSAKVSTEERDGSTHPTMKPVDLMAYLCRLVTPPDGLVLDPFMGSGSTGVACVREGFRFVGIEQSREYADIAAGRISKALAEFGSDTPAPDDSAGAV